MVRGAPQNLTISESDEIKSDLNPGDAALFEIGDFYSRTRMTMMKGGEKLAGREFQRIYAGTQRESFRFNLGPTAGGYTIFLDQLKDDEDPPFIFVKFTANDTPSLLLKISLHADDTRGIRLAVEELTQE